MKKKLLGFGLLYTILDTKIIEEADRNIYSLADQLAYYGVNIFQLRAKDISDKILLQLSLELRKIIHRRRKLFIVNDRADIAYLSGADGLHLGCRDITPLKAREILNKNSIVGRTIHSLNELQLFSKERIDYFSIGPVFKTDIKPTLPPLSFKKLKFLIHKANKLNKPVFAIGGINLDNVKSLVDIGIRNVAVCKGIILADNLKKTVREYKRCLEKVF